MLRVGRVVPALIGLDIETDTTEDGLDPGVAAVVAAAISTASHGDTVLTGDETTILAGLDATLAALPPSTLVTWNGGAFDLPFLAARARRHGIRLGLELHWDPSASRSGRPPLPGSIGTYAARWWSHGHLDAYRAWRSLTPDPDQSCALKAVARREGLATVELARESLHRATRTMLRRYVCSDASLTRLLAERRWPALRCHVDRLPAGGQLALGSC